VRSKKRVNSVVLWAVAVVLVFLIIFIGPLH